MFSGNVLSLYQSVPTDPAILLALHYMFCLIGHFLSKNLGPCGVLEIQSVFRIHADRKVITRKLLLVSRPNSLVVR